MNEEEIILPVKYVEKLQQENKELKDKLNGVYEEREYLFNKLNIENNFLIQENARLKDKNKKAIDKLEYYNSGEALWYVPIQKIIDILKEN